MQSCNYTFDAVARPPYLFKCQMSEQSILYNWAEDNQDDQNNNCSKNYADGLTGSPEKTPTDTITTLLCLPMHIKIDWERNDSEDLTSRLLAKSSNDIRPGLRLGHLAALGKDIMGTVTSLTSTVSTTIYYLIMKTYNKRFEQLRVIIRK